MKKIVSLLTVLCLAFAFCVPALASSYAGAERVVIGANLDTNEILSVYSQFGITRGSVSELTVTNAEERAYLEGIISESVIGTRSISCIYIKLLSANSGLSVTTNNINWCTEDMYRSALMTAGIYDAQVKVCAPYPVSGTAALTGVYKAYENITGTSLNEAAKAAAADELVVTAQLADALSEAGSDVDTAAIAEQISSADAVAIVNELKIILDETKNMSDEELRAQIVSIVDSYGYTISDDYVNKLVSLCRSLEGLSIAQLTDKVQQFQSSISRVQEFADKAATFGEKVSGVVDSVIGFFQGLFS